MKLMFKRFFKGVIEIMELMFKLWENVLEIVTLVFLKHRKKCAINNGARVKNVEKTG